jgi:uncharacterized membrane protein
MTLRQRGTSVTGTGAAAGVDVPIVVTISGTTAGAYLAALWFLGAFVPYQVYRIVLTHSLGLIALTVVDLVVMALIWHEYHVRTQARLTSG